MRFVEAMSPVAITVGGFNGDAASDLAIPNQGVYPGTVTVALANRAAGCGGYNGAAPTVSLLRPGRGWTVAGTLTVAATAQDDVAVTRVRFFADDALVGEDTTPPYEIDWDTRTLPEGEHTVAAKAFDAAGNVGASQPVAVIVVSNDTVVVQRARYTVVDKTLDVEAASNVGYAALTVSVAATGEVIGRLESVGAGTYRGRFTWPHNPENIRVHSDLGGSADSVVTGHAVCVSQPQPTCI